MVALRILICYLFLSLVDCSCDYKGTNFQNGQTWVAEDRCNTCTCKTDGTYTCETKNCTPVTCHDNGRDYNIGDAYLSSDGCNECVCTVNGAACTLMACYHAGAGVGYFHVPRCYYHGHVYTVGDAFQAIDGCNRCICTEKQISLCTRMFCPPSTIKPPETTKVPTCSYNGQVHSVGDTFSSTDGCNTCQCTATEQVSCTEMACLPQTTELPTTTMSETATPIPLVKQTTEALTCNYSGRIYTAGDKFKADDGCNTCTCGGNDRLICTLMACPSSTKSTTDTVTTASSAPQVKSTAKPKCIYNGREYEFGQSFKADDGCNTCTCAGNGAAACTLMLCPPTSSDMVTTTQQVATAKTIKCDYNGVIYSLDDVFNSTDGCNTCRCTEKGVACTKILCSSTTVPSTTNVVKCNYNGHIYSVGDSFKSIDGCNTCRCMSDGGVACTKMYCPSTSTIQTSTQNPIEKMTATTEAGKCDYNGQVYSVGDGFKAMDGCNSCKCIGEQQVACTKMHCGSTSEPMTTMINHLKITMNRLKR